MAGSAGAAWEVVLRYLNATPFGVADPIFGRDVAFFVFTLPLYRFIHGWLTGLIVLTLLAGVSVYLFRVVLPQLPLDGKADIEDVLSTPRVVIPFSRASKAHLSFLATGWLLLMAWGYRLEIYELVFSTRGAAYGAGYTDIHARWPALNVLTGLAVLAALFLLRLFGGDVSHIPSALIGKPVPQTNFPPVPELLRDGLPVPGIKPADFNGAVTVVNVWASWCAPCRNEAPLLMQMAQDKRIRVVGINYKDRPENARRFLGAFGNPFAAVGADADGRLSFEWGVYGVPETFVIDREGRIRYRHVGPLQPRDVERTIRPLLTELAR